MGSKNLLTLWYFSYSDHLSCIFSILKSLLSPACIAFSMQLCGGHSINILLCCVFDMRFLLRAISSISASTDFGETLSTRSIFRLSRRKSMPLPGRCTAVIPWVAAAAASCFRRSRFCSDSIATSTSSCSVRIFSLARCRCPIRRDCARRWAGTTTRRLPWDNLCEEDDDEEVTLEKDG